MRDVLLDRIDDGEAPAVAQPFGDLHLVAEDATGSGRAAHDEHAGVRATFHPLPEPLAEPAKASVFALVLPDVLEDDELAKEGAGGADRLISSPASYPGVWLFTG